MSLEKCIKCGCYCREYAPLPEVGKFVCINCAKILAKKKE